MLFTIQEKQVIKLVFPIKNQLLSRASTNTTYSHYWNYWTWSQRTLNAEPQILNAVEENHGTSIRRLSAQPGVSIF